MVKLSDSILFFRIETENSAFDISSFDADNNSYSTSYEIVIPNEFKENIDKSVTVSEIDMISTFVERLDNDSMKATNISCDRVLKLFLEIPIKI